MEPLFYLLIGVILGVIYSATMIAGVVWCVQITIRRGLRAGAGAGLGISAAQTVWAALAAGTVCRLFSRYADRLDWFYRLAAAGMLLYLASGVLRARKIRTLHYGGPLRGFAPVGKTSFGIALAMPMRFAGYLALFVAVNFHLRQHPLTGLLWFSAGIGLGSFLWWFNFSLLAWLFGNQVPEDVSLHSLNKLRVLAAVVLGALFLICLAPMVPGFR